MQLPPVRSLIARGFLLLVVLAIGGCATPVYSPQPVDEIPSDLTVVVHSSVRQASVELVSANMTNSENGLKQIVAQLHKKGSRTTQVFYRAVWFDEYGTPIQSMLSNWRAIFVEGGLYADMRLLAPSDKAETARLELTIKKKFLNTNPDGGN